MMVFSQLIYGNNRIVCSKVLSAPIIICMQVFSVGDYELIEIKITINQEHPAQICSKLFTLPAQSFKVGF